MDRCVVDGELVIPTAEGLDFDLLSQRIHPADYPHFLGGDWHTPERFERILTALAVTRSLPFTSLIDRAGETLMRAQIQIQDVPPLVVPARLRWKEAR